MSGMTSPFEVSGLTRGGRGSGRDALGTILLLAEDEGVRCGRVSPDWPGARCEGTSRRAPRSRRARRPPLCRHRHHRAALRGQRCPSGRCRLPRGEQACRAAHGQAEGAVAEAAAHRAGEVPVWWGEAAACHCDAGAGGLAFPLTRNPSDSTAHGPSSAPSERYEKARPEPGFLVQVGAFRTCKRRPHRTCVSSRPPRHRHQR
jgi:hypothetical protein